MNQVEVKRRQIQAFSFILGLLTIVLLGKAIGDNGIAYLAASVEGLLFFLLPAAVSVPDALGRMLRGRNAKGQFKNVEKIRKNIMIYQAVIGVAGSVALFALSDLLAEYVFGIPYSAFPMKLLAPVIFLRSVSGVLQGYFQGSGTEMPTVVAGVLRQLFMLGFGLLFANMLKAYGVKAGALLRSGDVASMYGAAGAAVAMVLAEILILLFLFLIYLGSGRKAGRRQEGLRATDSFGSSVRILLGGMIGLTLINVLIKLPVWLGLILYGKSGAGFSPASYGVYYGKYLAVCALPVLLYTALTLPLCARTVSSFRREEQRFARELFQTGLRACAVHAFFAAVFTAVMARQIVGALFGEGQILAVQMLQGGSAMIVFAVFGAFFVRLLSAIGRRGQALASLSIYALVSGVCLFLFWKVLPSGVMGLVYAGVFGSGALLLAAGFFAYRQLRVRPDVVRGLAFPAAAAGITGLLCMLLGKLLTPHLGNGTTLIVCLVMGISIYWVLILLLRCFRGQELAILPGGLLVRGLARMLHVE